ncbi:hypothetical protein ACLOJK_002775 [Asimina triloba]
MMGIFGILREALKIMFWHGKLVHSIVFLLPIPFSILFLCYQLGIQPLGTDLITKLRDLLGTDPGSPEYKQLLLQILLLRFSSFWLASFAVSVLSSAATISASIADYLHKHVTVHELILALRRIWKRPTITFLWVTFFHFCWSLLLLASIYFLITTKVDLIATIGILGLVAVVLGLVPTYLTAIWMVGLVVSVAEDDYYGMRAFGKAGKIMEGRKLQGFVISVLSVLVVSPFSVIMGLGMGKSNQSKVTQLAIELGVMYVIQLVQMLWFVVYTVFYFECKKSRGEEVQMEIGGGAYGLVYTTPLFTDASLP